MKKEIKVPCDRYARVTGYYRPVDSWNIGKQEEFKQRKVYEIGDRKFPGLKYDFYSRAMCEPCQKVKNHLDSLQQTIQSNIVYHDLLQIQAVNKLRAVLNQQKVEFQEKDVMPPIMVIDDELILMGEREILEYVPMVLSGQKVNVIATQAEGFRVGK